MRRNVRMLIGICVLGLLLGPGIAFGQDDRGEILKVRESVWRAWFANDAKALERLGPADTIVISSDEGGGKTRGVVFGAGGGFGGRTGVFLGRNGEGVNPGWHTDSFK